MQLEGNFLESFSVTIEHFPATKKSHGIVAFLQSSLPSTLYKTIYTLLSGVAININFDPPINAIVCINKHNFLSQSMNREIENF